MKEHGMVLEQEDYPKVLRDHQLFYSLTNFI